MLDTQTRISWASDIKIKWLKNLKSYIPTGIQLSWRIRSKKNHFEEHNLPAICLVKNQEGLEIQMRISRASGIEIKRLKNPKSYACIGIQLSWRIRREKKSFWRTKSAHNLLSKKQSTTGHSNRNISSFRYQNQEI